MYLQIELAPEDRPFHRFLWRNLEDRDPDEYEFNRLVFGVNSCPFQAQLVTHLHAEKNAEKYPAAADAVLQSTYMDDTMDSTADEEGAKELYHQLSELWQTAGMHARKWISNSEEVLKIIPEVDRATEVDLDSGQLPTLKTLGVLWKAKEDTFTFTTSSNATIPRIHTKRSFLSRIATLFDPIGLLSPYIIRAKIIMQEVWISGHDWDQALPTQLSEKIDDWFADLKHVNKIHVPRCLQPAGAINHTELHFFCDASEQAYAVVGYQKTIYEDESVVVRQVIAKSKVAPLNAVSIPRLELLGSTMGAKIAVQVAKSLKINQDAIVYWSDSQSVLWWISRRSRTLKTFVANRVAKIQQISSGMQWRYVPTAQNPADLATRGTNVEDLATNQLWWEGPPYLREPSRENWPPPIQMEKPGKETVDEQKKTDDAMLHTRVINANQTAWRLEPTRFSTMGALQRTTAWVMRFGSNCQSKPIHRVTGELTVDELEDASRSWIRHGQTEGFQTEVDLLVKGKDVPSSSKLAGLRPFMDEDGVIRARSRLQHAEYLSYDARYPIILPRRTWVTKLIVRAYHGRDGHAKGTNHTLSALSGKYWVMQGREAIREVERECNRCSRQKAVAARQVMAPLPRSRVTGPLQAFARVAVDYAGPFETIQGRGKARAKRYLCLFTCMLSRAVHLEVAYSLDTNSFLNAFYRMTSRRGLPTEVLSDNGTNFVGGQRELQELVEALETPKIERSGADKGIKWNFNPPLAPHFGGVHETMVKAAKKAIRAVLGNATITDEELLSAVVGVEDLLNSRPITYQTANPDDAVPLTPNHFLHGRTGGQFAPSSVDVNSFSPHARWRRVQELVRHFWMRWLTEWIPALARSKKWSQVRRNLKEGEVVLVIEPNMPRGSWALGRIVTIYPGSDGHVRTVQLQVRGKVIVRPITKVCPLELSC